MRENNATATWEYWSGERSRVHNCYNGIGNWFYQALGGLRIDGESCAYKHFVIDVQAPESITWARVSKESAFGTIKVSWEKTASEMCYKISVPVGSTATVKVPAGYRSKGNTINTDGLLVEAGTHVISFLKDR